MLGQAPNRAIVIAASNSFSDGIHAAGQVAQDGFFDLVWNIPNADSTNNELELWYAGADRLMLEIIAPNGRSLAQVNPGESKTLTGNNRVVLLAASRLHDPNNGDNLIGVFLERGLPPGQWTLRLHGQTVTDGRFHAWIERDDSGQSGFLPPHDNSHTLGSVSCGHLPLVTGSYDAHKPSTPLSFFSSAGPTRDGRRKPEVSAPGHAVFAAHSRTRTLVTRKSGTSMAAPAVTGLVALLLAEAHARGLSLTAQEIRDVVINSARRDPPAGTNWDDRFGFGRVSAAATLAAVIARAQPPAPVTATTAKPRKKRKK
jgi:subtilisin family serine protease